MYVKSFNYFGDYERKHKIPQVLSMNTCRYVVTHQNSFQANILHKYISRILNVRTGFIQTEEPFG